MGKIKVVDDIKGRQFLCKNGCSSNKLKNTLLYVGLYEDDDLIGCIAFKGLTRKESGKYMKYSSNNSVVEIIYQYSNDYPMNYMERALDILCGFYKTCIVIAKPSSSFHRGVYERYGFEVGKLTNYFYYTTLKQADLKFNKSDKVLSEEKEIKQINNSIDKCLLF